MGQKKTWSFHHVPFTMLWESMSLDYKNNWQSIIANKMLDCYSEAIFDKEYTSNKFMFTWSSKYFRTNIIKLILKNQRSDICCINFNRLTNIKLKFTWIENANKGTNESSCMKSYLIKQNNNLMLFNFFFRENFNLVKLKQDSNSYANINNELLNLKENIKQAIQIRSKNKYFWILNRNYRKINKKYNLFFNNLKKSYLSCFLENNKYLLKNTLSSERINDLHLLRLKQLNKITNQNEINNNYLQLNTHKDVLLFL